ncbi:bifunctional GNAT family N-acetyltransferase/acetate--CoA ligase family protein [Saccharopolyspora erythraea]|uniref:Possible acetyl-CoA synthetase n=1 Tax=Saccharopolyspora erythraea (strain ATCC 11635 / DSM 40517 / JCM 4748 / NBRC 13426 / NCIMB 8594 / NRRL 2338) TaxID=405948 RepID=A4FAM1_SACEN|nr:bifunctional GNAT family N-acetyltransferase/acetate--CoA ligase family protein [Saccharopolyspora erythraea]EQD84343.1 CoA-binding protein [Saccharopolyspora erythraea D]QRK93419.1 GNAT family N-acetyltransferase [Saccharopolyspora erythraea]CAM01096.1 possible acetyl-CoA synthetase [Saccharopolyspora erythraea NRRL 2338]
MQDQPNAQAEHAAYPRQWEADVVLSDGGTVHLRPIRPEDAEGLIAFHSRLSDRTRYFRYFGPYPRMPKRDVDRFSQVDYVKRVALVALLGDDIVAVGRFDRLGDQDSAEVAFVVQDEHQGRGLGSILLEHLAAAARERGLRRFVAEVLAENSTMVRVFRDAGYQVRRAMEEGVVHLEFDIDPTEESVAVARAREQAAEARSVHNLLHPRSVAVIGASTDHAKIGHAVLTNLLTADFAGPVYPVNPEHRSVRGVRAYPSVLDIPDDVDLAVVAIPAAGVDEVLDACLAKGVKALVIVSSGFSEAGPDGREIERRMVRAARVHGMRVVGPNALGVVNTDPGYRVNATLAPRLPGRGRTGFFCQSGALGVAILATAAERGLGLSTFVSAGNRADVSGNDLLQYWQTDPGTDVVLLYLESFGNPRKFARLARRLARTKPIVVVKSGRNAVRPGLAATSVQVDETSVQALFDQSGVIRVESVAEMFDTAVLLAHQPLPAGERVAIVGNSSALGMLAADVAQAQGLRLAGEPVDVGAAAGPEEFAAAVREAALRTDVDALVTVFAPPVAVPGTAYARALREALRAAEVADNKPVVTTFLAAEGVPDELAVPGADGAPGRGSVPSYPSPERAVLALARATRYARWRAAPKGHLLRPDGIDAERARGLVEAWLTDDLQRLTDDRTVELLRCYGIELVAFRRADSPEEAAAAAAELGYPVALKSVSDKLRHRSDLVGVRLDLAGEEAVLGAYADLRRVSGQDEVYVQRMAERGTSCVIGLVEDPSFGTLVSFGLAGVASELLGDTAYRAVPLTDMDAAALVRAPRAAPLLAGYRGGAPADFGALEDLVLRVAALAEDLPEVRELALQPVLASSDGVAVTGARLSLGRSSAVPDTGPRRLR